MAGDRRLFVFVLIMPVAVVAARAGMWSASSKPAATQAAILQAASSRPASTRAEATRPVERVVLRQDFEAEQGNWGGKIITDNVPPGSKRALAAVPTETHWARRATVNFRGRAGGQMVLKFRYYISKDIPLTIYIFDRTQKDNLRYDVRKPAVGRWTDVQVNMNAEFRRNDGSGGRLQAGDSLSDISFLSGKTGVDEFDMAVDDVEIVAIE
jgi:hypothetical protein